jgi:hypothetical protein
MDRRSRPGHLRRSLAGLALGAGLLALGSGAALAADPSPEPTEIVFNSPQYLVWWESHMTYNGPVVDQVYDLFTEGPVEPGHFVVPDGSGGVFHYSGRLVGGPYRTDTELCPQMIALGIESLQVWPPAMIGGSTIVDCERFRATPAPSPEATDAGGGGAAGGSSSGTGATGGSPDEPSDEALDIAAGLIGMLLFGGGLTGLTRGRPPRRPPALATAAAGGGPTVLVEPAPATVPSPDSTRPAREQPKPPDPCAAQQTDFDHASVRSVAVADALQTARRFEAAVDQQVARLANLTIPMHFGIDVAFLVGAQYGSKLGWGYVPKHLLGKFVDGAFKEVLKTLGKECVEKFDFARLEDLYKKGGEGGAKGYLKEIIKEGLMSSGASRRIGVGAGWLDPLAPNAATKNLTLNNRLWDEIAGPMSEIVGHLMSVYNASLSTAAQIQQLDIIRAQLLNLHGATTQLEIQLEDALNAQHFAADRLSHCRLVNSPGWRP